LNKSVIKKIGGMALILVALVLWWVAFTTSHTLPTFSDHGSDISFTGYLGVLGQWFGFFGAPIILTWSGYRLIRPKKGK
jgi:hypothetical protein